MPLESCMILLDCSEYMRNGDYIPNRLEAQQDAANLLVGAKTQSHPESTVGISAGTELLVSPTDDVGKILSAVHGLELGDGIPRSNNASSNGSARSRGGPRGGGSVVTTTTTAGGTSDITSAVQVASLALKHRRNKNGSQRIVLFVGTPLTNIESRALQRAGRQLKKNNVAIDVVALGELETNETKLRELVDAANGGGSRNEPDGGERTCHLVTIPPGVLPSDVLASSPVLAGAGAFAASAAAAAAGAAAGTAGAGAGAFDGGPGAGAAGAGANPFAEYGGVDPNMDPELAMALRVSMEEERARQERAAAAAAEAASSSSNSNSESKDEEMTDAAGAVEGDGGDGATNAGGGGGAASTDAATAAAAATTAGGDMVGFSEEEALLQQALAMSMNENDPPSSSPTAEGDDSKPSATTSETTTATAAGSAGAGDVAMEEDEDDDDAAMQMALRMSMQEDKEGEEGKSEKPPAATAEFADPAFVNELLGGSLPPGASQEMQEAFRKAQEEQQKAEMKKTKEGCDDKKDKEEEK